MFVADFGIRQILFEQQMVAASVGLGCDKQPDDLPLPDYIQKQMAMIGDQLEQAIFAGPRAVPFEGAEESYLLFIRHNVDSVGSMIHAQTYIRLGNWFGIVTLTTLEANLPILRADYDAFVRGLRIQQPQVDAEGQMPDGGC